MRLSQISFRSLHRKAMLVEALLVSPIVLLLLVGGLEIRRGMLAGDEVVQTARLAADQMHRQQVTAEQVAAVAKARLQESLDVDPSEVTVTVMDDGAAHRVAIAVPYRSVGSIARKLFDSAQVRAEAAVQR